MPPTYLFIGPDVLHGAALEPRERLLEFIQLAAGSANGKVIALNRAGETQDFTSVTGRDHSDFLAATLAPVEVHDDDSAANRAFADRLELIRAYLSNERTRVDELLFLDSDLADRSKHFMARALHHSGHLELLIPEPGGGISEVRADFLCGLFEVPRTRIREGWGADLPPKL